MRALIWRVNHIDSLDRVRSTRPHGIAEFREYDRNPHSYPNAWSAFVTVESGDGLTSADWLAKVTESFEQKDQAGRVVILPFAHLSNDLAPPKVARAILESSVSVLRGKGLTVERITFGTSKRLRWDVSSSALENSYVESSINDGPRPAISGMFLKLGLLEYRSSQMRERLSNLVAIAYSHSSGVASRFVSSVIQRLNTLQKQRFYDTSELVVIPLALGGSVGSDPRLTSQIVRIASESGWRASSIPRCDRITFELVGQPADASYFEYPRP